jgi:LssY C-terminus
MVSESSLSAEPSVPSAAAAAQPPQHNSRRRHLVILVYGLVLAYLTCAYVVLPVFWKVRTHRHPALDDVPNITQTGSGIPGDPLNVALIGTETELKKSMLAAKWYPANALTFRSCLKIAEATVLKRPYDEAPVSNLYLFGRKEDLAFEQPVGKDPRQRHHVRFWKSDEADADGRPVWLGSATYDRKVGLSHTTGQITHHIAADIDAERDHLFAGLKESGALDEFYVVRGFHKNLTGRNGGGDPWHTDGDLVVGVLKD